MPAPDEVLARSPRFPPIYLVSFARTLFGDFRLSFSVGDLSGTDAGRVTLAILDVMRQAVLSRRAVLVLMTIPRPILPRGSDTERMLATWAQRTGTPFLNLRTAYLELPAAERGQLYRGHWTAHGAAVTARLLAEKLRSLGPDRPLTWDPWPAGGAASPENPTPARSSPRDCGYQTPLTPEHGGPERPLGGVVGRLDPREVDERPERHAQLHQIATRRRGVAVGAPHPPAQPPLDAVPQRPHLPPEARAGQAAVAHPVPAREQRVRGELERE